MQVLVLAAQNAVITAISVSLRNNIVSLGRRLDRSIAVWRDFHWSSGRQSSRGIPCRGNFTRRNSSGDDPGTTEHDPVALPASVHGGAAPGVPVCDDNRSFRVSTDVVPEGSSAARTSDTCHTPFREALIDRKLRSEMLQEATGSTKAMRL
jgi:hypothetical protein